MARSYFNYESMLRWRAEWLEKQLTGKLLIKTFLFDLDRGSSFEELEEAPEFRQGGAKAAIAAYPPTF